MSKNNKQKTNNTHVTREFPNLEGDTILKRFQEYEKTYGGEIEDVKQIIEFVSIENARYIALIGMDRLPEGTEKECLIFCQYLAEKYGEQTWNRINASWPNGPLVFRMAASCINANASSGQNTEPGSSATVPQEYTRRCCEMLADYIIGIKADRYLSVTCDSEKISGSYCFPASVSPKKQEDMQEIIKVIIREAAQGIAGIVLRYRNPGSKYDVVNGFRFLAGKIERVPKGELRRCCTAGLSPAEIPKDERYQVAPIIFPKI